VHPGWNHPGFIQNQDILGGKKCGEFVKGVVSVRPALAIKDHQPGSVARLGRALRDPVGGQVVIEIGELHRIT
jgi:hypothetical protein